MFEFSLSIQITAQQSIKKVQGVGYHIVQANIEQKGESGPSPDPRINSKGASPNPSHTVKDHDLVSTEALFRV